MWQVTRKQGICIPTAIPKIRHNRGLVRFTLGPKYVDMGTPVAHRIGFALVKHAGEALPNESIVLKINGVALEYPPISAKKIGAALLIKADSADDFQLGVSR